MLTVYKTVMVQRRQIGNDYVLVFITENERGAHEVMEQEFLNDLKEVLFFQMTYNSSVEFIFPANF